MVETLTVVNPQTGEETDCLFVSHELRDGALAEPSSDPDDGFDHEPVSI